jgi:hypothetical protein
MDPPRTRGGFRILKHLPNAFKAGGKNVNPKIFHFIKKYHQARLTLECDISMSLFYAGN